MDFKWHCSLCGQDIDNSKDPDHLLEELEKIK